MGRCKLPRQATIKQTNHTSFTRIRYNQVTKINNQLFLYCSGYVRDVEHQIWIVVYVSHHHHLKQIEKHPYMRLLVNNSPNAQVHEQVINNIKDKLTQTVLASKFMYHLS